MLYHVPSGFEVAVVRVRDGIRSLERAQVGDHRPAVAVDAEHAVRDARHAVRAAGSCQQPIQLVTDERKARDAADEAPERGARLAGRSASTSVDTLPCRSILEIRPPIIGSFVLPKYGAAAPCTCPFGQLSVDESCVPPRPPSAT
jgi:hypothetical protein